MENVEKQTEMKSIIDRFKAQLGEYRHNVSRLKSVQSRLDNSLEPENDSGGDKSQPASLKGEFYEILDELSYLNSAAENALNHIEDVV
jgi:hypothetical protein